MIQEKRGAQNRLGFAVQLCMLRYPGTALAQNESPSDTLLTHAARQLQVAPALWSRYAERDTTRREHQQELQAWLGLASFTVDHHDRSGGVLLLIRAIDSAPGVPPTGDGSVQADILHIPVKILPDLAHTLCPLILYAFSRTLLERVMSFTAYRSLLIAKLTSGEYAHEPREVMAEKNLLAVGDLSAADVIRLLQRCTRQQYHVSPHHWTPRIAVHLFQPIDADGTPWYIKAYFTKGGAMFISVHT